MLSVFEESRSALPSAAGAVDLPYVTLQSAVQTRVRLLQDPDPRARPVVRDLLRRGDADDRRPAGRCRPRSGRRRHRTAVARLDPSGTDDLDVRREALTGLGEPAAFVGDEAGVAAGSLEGAVDVVHIAAGSDAARPLLHPGPAGVAQHARPPQDRALVAPPLIDIDHDVEPAGQPGVGAGVPVGPDRVTELHDVTYRLRAAVRKLPDQRLRPHLGQHAAELPGVGRRRGRHGGRALCRRRTGCRRLDRAAAGNHEHAPGQQEHRRAHDGRQPCSESRWISLLDAHVPSLISSAARSLQPDRPEEGWASSRGAVVAGRPPLGAEPGDRRLRERRQSGDGGAGYGCRESAISRSSRAVAPPAIVSRIPSLTAQR